MKRKTFAIVYALAMIASIFNAYFGYKQDNFEAMIAWICASGMAGGSLGATIELIEKENEDTIS